MSRYSDLKAQDERNRPRRAGGGKRRSLLGSVTHLLAQAGPGVAHLAQSAWRTAGAAERFRQGQPSRGQTRPYNLRDIGDVATYGALSKGPGAFEQATGGPQGIAPQFLSSAYQTQSRLANPTQYIRAARGQEGYGELLPMLVEDIGNLALVAAPTAMALRGAAGTAAGAGRATAAARLGTAARVAQRTAAVGGEIADLGLPRLGGIAGRQIFPPSAAAVAEAAARGRVPSAFVGPVEAAGRAMRSPFAPGRAPVDSARFRMAKRYPMLLTNEGRAMRRGTILPAAREATAARVLTEEPLKRAALAPTLEDMGYVEPRVPRLPPKYPQTIIDPRNPPPGGGGPLVGPDGTPIGPMGPAAERAAARRAAAAAPVPMGPAVERRRARLAGEEPVTGQGGRRTATVPRPREGYTPADVLPGDVPGVINRGLRGADPDLWEMMPDGTLQLKPQHYGYPGGRGAIAFGTEPAKSISYAIETGKMPGGGDVNNPNATMLQLDTNRLGLPVDPDMRLFGGPTNTEPTLFYPYGPETREIAYAGAPESLGPRRSEQATIAETQTLEALDELDKAHPGWEDEVMPTPPPGTRIEAGLSTRDQQILMGRLLADEAAKLGIGPYTSRVLNDALVYGHALPEDFVGLRQGTHRYMEDPDGGIYIRRVGEETIPPPLTVPKGAWRTMTAAEMADVPLRGGPPPPVGQRLVDVSNNAVAEIKARAERARDLLDVGADRAAINEAVFPQQPDMVPDGAGGLVARGLQGKVRSSRDGWEMVGQPEIGMAIDSVYDELMRPIIYNPTPPGGTQPVIAAQVTPDVQLRESFDRVIDFAAQVIAEIPATAPRRAYEDNPLLGQGGFNRARPLPEPGTVTSQRAIYAAPRTGGGRVEPTVTRITPRPPPPIEPPTAGNVLGEPPPAGPRRTTIARPPPPTRTTGGGGTLDAGGPLDINEQGAAAAVYQGADTTQAALDNPILSGRALAEAVVPMESRRWRDTVTGERHPEFFTADQIALARAYRAGELPPEQMARIERGLGALQQTYNRVTQLNQAGVGQTPVDPSQLAGEVRPSPQPLDEVVDYLAENEVITPDEQNWLHGREWDPELNDGDGGWKPDGSTPDELRIRRSRFYETDPRFMEDTPALQNPLIYAAAWRNRMAEARIAGASVAERVEQSNEAVRQATQGSGVFGQGAPQATAPVLPQTPMQLGAKGVIPQYLPAGRAPSDRVALPRRMEGIDSVPGDLPPRSSFVRSAETPTGPTSFEGIAERFGADAARATYNHYYGDLLAKGGRLEAGYGWDGNADIDPTNPYFDETQLRAMHDTATDLTRNEGGTFQQNYNRILVDEMEKKGWEPWPEKGAIGQPLTLEDRRVATKGEQAFGMKPADIGPDTPWLRLGTREAASPYMIPKVPGSVIQGLAKFNKVFKGVTLAPNVRWQLGDAVTHYLLAMFEGINPGELRTNINRAREMGGQIGAMPGKGALGVRRSVQTGERVRGRTPQTNLRVGGQSEAGRMLMEHIRPQSTRIGDPYGTPEIGGKLQPGREPTGTQRAPGKVRQMWDPTVGRFVDASYRFNQTGNNLRREAMYLAQLDRRIQKAGMSLDDPATLERLAKSSPANDPKLYEDIRAAVDRTNKVMGDTEALAPFERDYLTQIFPFWTWTSTVARLTSALAINNPSRLLFTMYVGNMVANGQSPELPGYLGTILGPGGWWPTAFANLFADIGGLPGLEGDNPNAGGSLLDQIGASNILRASSPALKLPAALAGIDLGQGQFLSRPPGTGRRDAYGREGLTPIVGDLGAMAYQALSQVPMGRRALNLLPRATLPLPGTDLTTGNVVRYDTGESMGFGGGTPLPTRLGSLAGLPLPFSQTRTGETQRLIAEREAVYRRGAKSRAKSKRRRQRQTARLPRYP